MNSNNFSVVGKSVSRVDIADKASGRTKYTNDLSSPGMLHAKLHISDRAHAMIHSINLKKAWEVSGVRAIITGESFPFPVGPLLADRPPLALKKVRYFGEPIALVVADTEQQAKKAAMLIEVVYEDLPVVNSPSEALKSDTPLIHEDLGSYKVQVKGVYPVPNTNIANLTKIRKGNLEAGWKNSDVKIDSKVSFGKKLIPQIRVLELMEVR